MIEARTRWFDRALDTVAMLWRLKRRDGIALGFTTHDRDLLIDGFRYRAAPGMTPSAVELDDRIDSGGMDIGGALSHDLIAEDDLLAGRWDRARIAIGLVDWDEPASGVFWIFGGSLGSVEQSGQAFSAELRGDKSVLEQPVAPRASPGCRAVFCGPGCQLSRAAFEHDVVLDEVDEDGLHFAGVDAVLAARIVHGSVIWLSGASAGLRVAVWSSEGTALVPEQPLPMAVEAGDRARLVEGCDHEFATCANRFGNALNFQGEPHLPGNDLLTRYPGG
ncbi:MAG: DUF2163 domain-containing protein [Blastomonas sp.]